MDRGMAGVTTLQTHKKILLQTGHLQSKDHAEIVKGRTITSYQHHYRLQYAKLHTCLLYISDAADE